MTPEEVKKLNCNEIVHGLCEMDLEGDLECTLQRLKVMLDFLKEKNLLKVLNSVPEVYSESLFMNEPNTPLSYWIGKGNLEAVKLLIEYGAAVRIEDPDAYFSYYSGIQISCSSKVRGYSSALYQAAKLGSVDIVQYLLEKGAKADFAFNDNVLRYFIPAFIFDLSSSIEFNRNIDLQSPINCLDLILASLPKDQLETQFKIPLHIPSNPTVSPENSIAFVKNISNGYLMESDSPAKILLIELLEKFGAKEDEVYSMEGVHTLGSTNGFTLSDINRRKS